MKLDLSSFLLAMAKAKLSNETLSRKSGVHVNTIANIKKNRRANPSTLGKLAEALGVDVADIIEKED